MQKIFFTIAFVALFCLNNYSQVIIGNELDNIDYSKPTEYEIGGIIVNGVKYLDHSVLIALSGLQVGNTIKVPGDKISKAIERLWKQGLFSDVKIVATKIIGNKIFLEIQLVERPRLASFSFKGVKKGEADEIREKIKLLRGTQVTDNTLSRSKGIIRNYYINKGYYNVDINIKQTPDTTLTNHINLLFDVKKHGKVKIEAITFEGNTVFKESKLRRAMKDTKKKRWYGMFKPSKYIKNLYNDDKKKIIDKYNEKGYRDARIVADTVFASGENLLTINIKIEEGRKFFIRDISWVGNSKYTSEYLSQAFGIKKGDIFDQKVMDERMYQAQDAISSIYYDDGYLFFNITPVETMVQNDSIDFEMRIYEGKQAHINRILISGNTITNDHVIRREIKTRPGDLFSRTNIIRSQRELAQLGYFDVEKFDIKTVPHPYDGTVDLEYVLVEQPSNQIELSGGWGAGIFIGSLRLTLTNLAIKDFFKKDAWQPFPTGDGQRLSLAAYTNGVQYQAYSISFVEPWLGGVRNNSLSVSLYHSILSSGRHIADISNYMKVTGASIGLGRQLEWPDDYFSLSNSLNFEKYNLKDYRGSFFFNTGKSNNFSFTTIFSRNSIDAPIYPRRGALLSVSLQITPPYSLFKPNKWWIQPAIDTTDLSIAEIEDLTKEKLLKENSLKYKWIEYHKWKFKASSFNTIVGDLVLNSKLEFGYIGHYNKDLGPSPFEQFQLGGDGLSGYNFYGAELIGLRGYDNGPNNTGSLTPLKGGNLYEKITFELRYPLSLNPNATFYVLSFAEAGNAWYDIKDFTPFELKRSAGIGLRVFMAMFGMIGIDWGYGFDEIPNRPGANKSHFAFSIGQQF
ncbi:MAG TPA: outer membrane protein assembly factor BamA [Salinivirgaceae bacterium]|nr:outer membrane protein assembly factor BamA [Salinivirgaceae bacterium]HQA75946.1 outer membrane protein assembly factor BamA [Salinivirgaceae bacterium]